MPREMSGSGTAVGEGEYEACLVQHGDDRDPNRNNGGMGPEGRRGASTSDTYSTTGSRAWREDGSRGAAGRRATSGMSSPLLLRWPAPSRRVSGGESPRSFVPRGRLTFRPPRRGEFRRGRQLHTEERSGFRQYLLRDPPVDAAVTRQEHSPRRATEALLRFAQVGKPQRLSPGDIDAASGQIFWPIILRPDLRFLPHQVGDVLRPTGADLRPDSRKLPEDRPDGPGDGRGAAPLRGRFSSGRLHPPKHFIESINYEGHFPVGQPIATAAVPPSPAPAQQVR